MKLSVLKFTFLAITAVQAPASNKYFLLVTNGSAMPISPFVAYAKNGQLSNSDVGQEPSRDTSLLLQGQFNFNGNSNTKVAEHGV